VHTWCLGKDCEKMWMISSMWFSRCGLKKKSDAKDDDDIWQLKVNPIHCDFILLRRSHKQYIKALVPLFAASCFWPTHFPTHLSPQILRGKVSVHTPLHFNLVPLPMHSFTFQIEILLPGFYLFFLHCI
jgi:hypothetical protein